MSDDAASKRTESTPAADANQEQPRAGVDPDASPVTSGDAERSNTNLTELPNEFGRYRILKTLDRGELGSIYLAEDIQLERHVVIKVPHLDFQSDSSQLERFLAEARSAAKIEHPNLCRLFDVGKIDDVHFLAVEYVEGLPLTKYLAGGTQIPERQAAGIVRKLAIAMHEAHSHDVLHRDLRPSNVMINLRKEPIIMNVGLSRWLDENHLSESLAKLPATTCGHMSPEIISGRTAEVGPKSDVYSLGVMLYEMLTGHLPFEGKSPEELARKICTEPYPPIKRFRKSVSPELEQICTCMLDKSSDSRLKSMRMVAKQLASFLQQSRSADESGSGHEHSSVAPSTITESGSQVNREKGSRDKSARDKHASDKHFSVAAEAKKSVAHRAPVPNAKKTKSESVLGPKSRPPLVLIAGGVGAVAILVLLAIAAMVIFSPAGTGTIAVRLVYPDGLPDPDADVVIMVDERAYSPNELAHPIELPTGIHEVVVKGTHYEATSHQMSIAEGNNDPAIIRLTRLDIPESIAPPEAEVSDQVPPDLAHDSESETDPSTSSDPQETETATTSPPTPDPADAVANTVNPDEKTEDESSGITSTTEVETDSPPVVGQTYVVDDRNRVRSFYHALAQAKGGDIIEFQTSRPITIGRGTFEWTDVAGTLTFRAAEGYRPVLVCAVDNPDPFVFIGVPPESQGPIPSPVEFDGITFVDVTGPNSNMFKICCGATFRRCVFLLTGGMHKNVPYKYRRLLDNEVQNLHFYDCRFELLRTNRSTTTIRVSYGRVLFANCAFVDHSNLPTNTILGFFLTKNYQLASELKIENSLFVGAGSFATVLIGDLHADVKNSIFFNFSRGLFELAAEDEKAVFEEAFAARMTEYSGEDNLFVDMPVVSSWRGKELPQMQVPMSSATGLQLWNSLCGEKEIDSRWLNPLPSDDPWISESVDRIVPLSRYRWNPELADELQGIGPDFSKLPTIAPSVRTVLKESWTELLPAAADVDR